MQKWEYIRVSYETDWGGISNPDEIFIWPSGRLDLHWVMTEFDLEGRVGERNSKDRIDLSNKKDREKREPVARALLDYLGESGWELVLGDDTPTLIFKRPIED